MPEKEESEISTSEISVSEKLSQNQTPNITPSNSKLKEKEVDEFY